VIIEANKGGVVIQSGGENDGLRNKVDVRVDFGEGSA
jgi:hypothetical protein